ncbi:MAG: aminotransferase class I/II-fold pyridoxal phosphate-dependent enzyme [Bacilli bacterium]|nr:aminotransferase class I/II-fold pyridoxal phosphate-dependent enzyme [Bacilli bacterium]
MKITAKHSTGKVLKRDNLQIGNEAKLAKLQDPKTIDGTTGIFYYDNYHFQGFRIVDKVLKELNDESLYTYSPSDGGAPFKEAALNWVFADYRNEIEEQLYLKVISSPGGTGALFNSVFNGLDSGETVLLPTPYWGPYSGMASNLGLKVKKYQFLRADKFNFEGFKEASNAIIKTEGKLVTILNDPCHNPTGYNLSVQEIQKIVDYLNTLKVPVILIYDIAYIDFSETDARAKFKLFVQAQEHILVSVAFSASKSFSVYGQRLGAQIIMGKDEAEVIDYYNASNYTARNTWSNANKALISFLISLDKNQDLKKEYLVELETTKAIIQERARLFLKEAEAINLKTYPYSSGFFISIPVKNNEEILDSLIKTEKIYLLPNEGSIRLSICSVPASDLKGLALKIKTIIDSIDG